MGLNETAVTTAQTLQGVNSLSSSFSARKSATIADVGYEADVLAQFKSNLNQLEELTQRLNFVLGDVQGLLKKRR